MAIYNFPECPGGFECNEPPPDWYCFRLPWERYYFEQCTMFLIQVEKGLARIDHYNQYGRPMFRTENGMAPNALQFDSKAAAEYWRRQLGG